MVTSRLESALLYIDLVGFVLCQLLHLECDSARIGRHQWASVPFQLGLDAHAKVPAATLALGYRPASEGRAARSAISVGPRGVKCRKRAKAGGWAGAGKVPYCKGDTGPRGPVGRSAEAGCPKRAAAWQQGCWPLVATHADHCMIRKRLLCAG